MCWRIKIGTCSHPEPVCVREESPDDPQPPPFSAASSNLTAGKPCRCTRYTTIYHTAKCNPCEQYLSHGEMTQEEFINKQLYNRNVTYYLQSSKGLGLRRRSLPTNITEWDELPNHVRFTVDRNGVLLEGVGFIPDNVEPDPFIGDQGDPDAGVGDLDEQSSFYSADGRAETVIGGDYYKEVEGENENFLAPGQSLPSIQEE
ncbi:hypothetical protein TWF694_006654 [Orbilia ellipsospora]|uniref:Uncharacterized protein n=1 Tax=Orbilia ellipsospora TaxID=2528407 RepID=A0AAV9XM47_9PEZI